VKNKHLLKLVEERTGHLLVPGREKLYADLATSLWAFLEKRSELLALLACIKVEREVLELHPLGHSERDKACSDLAFSLKTLYTQVKDSVLLVQVIGLNQEALNLRPPGHLD
jgi:hypothetical protein